MDLFISLEADESYLDSPFVFASAKEGWASLEFGEVKNDMTDLLDTIIDYTPAFEAKENAPFKVLVSTTDYDNYLGRIAIGKVESGQINKNDSCIIVNYNDKDRKVKSKIVTIYEFEGLQRSEVEKADFGSIVALSGMEDINIGDTICTESDMEPIEFTKISEPTLSMTFSVNNSPFAGRDGDYVTSRHLRDRLFKEKETDVSLRVETTDSTEAFKVSGMELATIDVDQEYTGSIIEKLGLRKGELMDMAPNSSGYTRMVFKIPARGLIGYRQEFLTDTKGTGILNTEFDSYERYKGDIAKRQAGSLISFETGVATTYGLHAAQSRGQLFVKPQDEVYEGEVIGSNAKGIDIDVNVCKKKKQTNVRASAADEALVLSPAKIMSVEEMMEFVEEDELIEITPHNLRIRKKILDNINQKNIVSKELKMKKRFERFLSSTLLLSVLVVLVSNLILILTKINPQVVNNVWSISFIISWVIMLIYPLYILMEKETRGYSIFVAIISIIVFAILSYHALLVVSNYTPLLPKYIAVDERISSYWQELFYSGLIIIYIVHLLNVILLNRLRSKEIKNND